MFFCNLQLIKYSSYYIISPMVPLKSEELFSGILVYAKRISNSLKRGML